MFYIINKNLSTTLSTENVDKNNQGVVVEFEKGDKFIIGKRVLYFWGYYLDDRDKIILSLSHPSTKRIDEFYCYDRDDLMPNLKVQTVN